MGYCLWASNFNYAELRPRSVIIFIQIRLAVWRASIITCKDTRHANRSMYLYIISIEI